MADIVIRISVFLILVFSMQSQAKQLGFSLDLNVASPAVEISKLQEEWQVDHSGKYAYGQGRLDSWFEVNPSLRVGISKRADYLIEFSEDTAQFYSRLEQNQISAGLYDLDLTVNGLMSQGVYLESPFQLSTKGKLKLRLHLLQGSIVQLGSLIGRGQVFDDGSFEYQYQLDYHFDHSRILNSPEVPVSGLGYALDIRLEYNLGRHWALKGSVDDLVYRMYWNQVNQDQGCVSRPTRPDCIGRTQVVSKTQSIQSQSDWMIYGLKGSIHPYVQWQSWGQKQAWILGCLYENYSAGWDLENEAMNFTYDSDRLQVKWAFDNIHVGDAHHWQFTLGTVWPIF